MKGNFKINKMSLKKPDLSNPSLLQDNPKSQYHVLPMINRNIINSAYNESTSVLSKYINTQANSFYKEARKFKMPLNKFGKKLELSAQNIAKTESNEIKEPKNFYITAQDEINLSSELSKDNNLNEDVKVHLKYKKAQTKKNR